MRQAVNASAVDNVFFAVLTTSANHEGRCRTVMATWGSIVPPKCIVFYSDRPHTELPVLAQSINLPVSYNAAQDRFTYEVLPDALSRMRKLDLQWLFYCDDDTFVWLENISPLLLGRDPNAWVWLGQRCSERHYCGGAGFLMSRAAVAEAAAIAPSACRQFGHVKASDERLGTCLRQLRNRTVDDRREFNSRPPGYYATAAGRTERPHGFGRAVTFHYLTLGIGISPDEVYQGLFALTRAGISAWHAESAAVAWQARIASADATRRRAWFQPARIGRWCRDVGSNTTTTEALGGHDETGCWHWQRRYGLSVSLHEAHRSLSSAERCALLRHPTSDAALAACRGAGAWCTAVVQDGGLNCLGQGPRGSQRLAFELRAWSDSGIQTNAATKAVWLLHWKPHRLSSVTGRGAGGRGHRGRAAAGRGARSTTHVEDLRRRDGDEGDQPASRRASNAAEE